MSHWTLDIYINNTVLAWYSSWNITLQNKAKLNEQITILSAIKNKKVPSLLWMISAQSIYSTWRTLQLKSLKRYRLQHTITRYICFGRLMKNIWSQHKNEECNLLNRATISNQHLWPHERQNWKCLKNQINYIKEPRTQINLALQNSAPVFEQGDWLLNFSQWAYATTTSLWCILGG